MSTRPNLSFITSQSFNELLSHKQWYETLSDEQKWIYTRVQVIHVPQLIQLAEMLFDMTAHEPDSLVHQMASKTLKDIAK